MRMRARLPASCRQATHVRTGSWPGFDIGLGIARLDVDAESGELGGQARILPVAADRERKLGARDHRRSRSRGPVDRYRVDAGRPQRGRDERLGVVGPGHDVDVLAGELAQDRAVTHTLWTDARYHGIQPG